MNFSSNKFDVYAIQDNPSIVAKEQRQSSAKTAGSTLNELYMYHTVRKFNGGFGRLLAAIITFEDGRAHLTSLHVPMRGLRRQVRSDPEFRFLLVFDRNERTSRSRFFNRSISAQTPRV